MTDTNAAATGSVEDVELLATRLMGWRMLEPGELWAGSDPVFWRWANGVIGYRLTPDGDVSDFAPLTSADADVQVLERVREVWDEQGQWRFACLLHDRWSARNRAAAAFVVLNLAQYVTGDYAWAASVILKTEEGK